MRQFVCLLVGITFCGWSLLATAQKRDVKISKLSPTEITHECAAEVNAGTDIDVACSIPADALYEIQLAAKNGSDSTDGFKWAVCATSAPYLCPGVSGSWASPGEFDEESGKKAIQARIVPFKGTNAPAVRARLTVRYQVPAKK